MTEALSEVCVHDSKLMHLVAVGLPRGQGPQGNNKKKTNYLYYYWMERSAELKKDYVYSSVYFEDKIYGLLIWSVHSSCFYSD